MIGQLWTTGRWIRGLVTLAVLLMVSATSVQAGSVTYHHGAGEAAKTCDHAAGQSPDTLPEHGGQCVATGMPALTVLAEEWVVVEMRLAADPPPLPASILGVSLASVSPPYKPPRS
ncbi:hypothetical protein [Magnetospirillum sp. 64-120]|uniref:hypothetical protein n=1 Tax=Magnetospirillum sp. 64-120 TaxID=1895778 RepID=UPI00092B787D|nr:hypothetical protein [Magnetospirillum sp. 64-120]OJX82946.1 MAG: hypothetical protein BGO92_20320 [Magnetospirillum sp. 64-120]